MIRYPPFKYRQEWSTDNHPAKYDGVTLIADGTHCLINYSQYDAEMIHPEQDYTKRNYISFKLKQPALNTQVCKLFYDWDTIKHWKKVVLTSDGYVCAVSSSKPAGSYNDSKQMNEEFNTLFEVLISCLLQLEFILV